MFCLRSDSYVYTLLAAIASVGELELVFMRCWMFIKISYNSPTLAVAAALHRQNILHFPQIYYILDNVILT